MRKHHFCIVFIIISGLISCARLNPEIRKDNAHELALSQGFISESMQTNDFKLQTFSKNLHQETDELRVYIEGDGLAWRRKNKLSKDPTPVTPVALQMAVQDPSPNVFYIARPCQFLNEDDLANCPVKYWSSHRYAEEVLQSFSEVIDKIKNRTGFKRLHIVGYSGGGVIAALLASLRDDVSLLLTVAANLDHSAWTNYHSVSSLTGSLDPLDYLSDLETVPQLHFVGEKDKIVPSQLTENFLNQMQDRMDVRLVIIPDFDHECCWPEEWPSLLKKHR